MELIKIKNHQYIRQLPVKELAELLIKIIEVNEGDEGIDGEWQDCYMTHYVSPNGTYSYDYEDALQNTIDWLNADKR